MTATERSHRYWLPISLLVIAGVLLPWVNTRPELDSNLKGLITFITIMTTVVLIALWFILLSRFSAKLRLMGLLLVLALVLGFKFGVRIEGSVDGTGRPRFVWKGTKAAERQFTQPVSNVAQPTLTTAPDVPQFLGPNRNGILPDSELSLDWHTVPPRELWRVVIGEGWGAFIVVGGRAITQEQRGDEEWVTAYDLGTGSILWHHADKARFVEWQGGDGPRATPTHQAGKLYTQGATGILNCLDVATGKVLWTHDLPKEHNTGLLTWGFASSPLIVDNLVIVCGAKTSGPTLLAFDKLSGELCWKSSTQEACYASPSLVTLAGKRVLVSNHSAGFSLHDPLTGSVLLDHAWGDGKWPKGSQPLVLPGDRIFLSAGYGMGCAMLQLKVAADGKFTAEELWQNNKMKTQFNSVTPSGDVLYGLDDGRLAAMDVANGERLWKEGRFGAGQHLLVGDKVLIQSEQGPVYLAAATREGFKELGKFDALSSKTWNYPTLAGRWLLVRNDRQAACYELPVLSAQ